MKVSLEQRNSNRLDNLMISISDMQDGTAMGNKYVIPLESGHFLLDDNDGKITIEFIPTPWR